MESEEPNKSPKKEGQQQNCRTGAQKDMLSPLGAANRVYYWWTLNNGYITIVKHFEAARLRLQRWKMVVNNEHITANHSHQRDSN